MALMDGQVQVRDIVMGRGTDWELLDFDPWTRTVRADQSAARIWAHGSWSGAEWLDSPTISWHVCQSARPDPQTCTGGEFDAWIERQEQLTAAFAPVEDGITQVELRFRFGTREYLMFGRPRLVDAETRWLSWARAGGVVVTVAFVALDPRRYGAQLLTESTGLPFFVSGLTVPSRQITSSPSSPPYGLVLDGQIGNYASTPDAAALDITGDIDLRVDLTKSTWPPSIDEYAVAKFDLSTNNMSYGIRIDDDGVLSFVWSENGSSFTSEWSTVPIPVSSGRLALRATLDVDNGANGHTVTFYTSDAIGGTWVQLGDPRVNSGVTSIFNSAAALTVGARDQGTASNVDGVIHAAEVRSGDMSGAVVANPRFDRAPHQASSFTGSLGLTWTVNGSATINADNRVFSDGITAPLYVQGTRIGGEIQLLNVGLAPTPLALRIDGPVIRPRITLVDPDGTAHPLRMLFDLQAGDFLNIDTAGHTVLLNGTGNRRADVSGEFALLQPGMSTLRFNSSEFNDVATLTASWRPAW